VDRHHRDGLLALATCTLLVAISIQARQVDALFGSRAAVTGVVGALMLELLLLRYPERTRGLWERSVVRAAAVLVTVATGLFAWWSAPWLLAVLVWGLLAYLVLLGVVIIWGKNPLVRVGQS
jgi:hypothetical protein